MGSTSRGTGRRFFYTFLALSNSCDALNIQKEAQENLLLSSNSIESPLMKKKMKRVATEQKKTTSGLDAGLLSRIQSAENEMDRAQRYAQKKKKQSSPPEIKLALPIARQRRRFGKMHSVGLVEIDSSIQSPRSQISSVKKEGDESQDTSPDTWANPFQTARDHLAQGWAKVKEAVGLGEGTEKKSGSGNYSMGKSKAKVNHVEGGTSLTKEEPVVMKKSSLKDSEPAKKSSAKESESEKKISKEVAASPEKKAKEEPIPSKTKFFSERGRMPGHHKQNSSPSVAGKSKSNKAIISKSKPTTVSKDVSHNVNKPKPEAHQLIPTKQANLHPSKSGPHAVGMHNKEAAKVPKKQTQNPSQAAGSRAVGMHNKVSKKQTQMKSAKKSGSKTEIMSSSKAKSGAKKKKEIPRNVSPWGQAKDSDVPAPPFYPQPDQAGVKPTKSYDGESIPVGEPLQEKGNGELPHPNRNVRGIVHEQWNGNSSVRAHHVNHANGTQQYNNYQRASNNDTLQHPDNVISGKLLGHGSGAGRDPEDHHNRDTDTMVNPPGAMSWQSANGQVKGGFRHFSSMMEKRFSDSEENFEYHRAIMSRVQGPVYPEPKNAVQTHLKTKEAKKEARKRARAEAEEKIKEASERAVRKTLGAGGVEYGSVRSNMEMNGAKKKKKTLLTEDEDGS